MTDISDIKRELENGGFELGQHDYIELGDDYVDFRVTPYIADPEAWKQYSDDALYDAEKRLRSWLGEMALSPTFKSKRGARTFQFAQVFQILFGRAYNQKTDGRYSTPLSRLFRYYCSRTGKSVYDKETGKQKSKTSYTFSAARVKRPPYSLRLRLEWLLEQGMIPTAENMKLPKDIAIGKARNPYTEAHREEQREAGRKHYNEYQQRLKREHKDGRPARKYNRRTPAADDAVQDDRRSSEDA